MGAQPGVYMLMAAAFFAGLAVGWFAATARVRLGGSMRVSSVPQGTTPGIHTSWSSEVAKATAKARTMELRCQCGSVWKFRDPPEPGFEPFPPGNSFSCPKCGHVTDFERIRKLVQDVQS